MTKEQITQKVEVKFRGTLSAQGSGTQGLSSGVVTFAVEGGVITYEVGEVEPKTTITSDVTFSPSQVEKSELKVDASGNLYGDKDGKTDSVTFTFVGYTSGKDTFGNQFKVTITGEFDAVENFPKKEGDVTTDDKTTEGFQNVKVEIAKI